MSNSRAFPPEGAGCDSTSRTFGFLFGRDTYNAQAQPEMASALRNFAEIR